MLPRAGNTDLPEYSQVSALSVADDIAVEIEVPNAGTVRGFGIPAGITVLLGDACSGRIDLMRALAAGIYNHAPGDGRELVITVPDAVYVAAEAGRSVQRVDLSAFVPGDEAMKSYTSGHADRFAAQAAGTVEALEAGARVLLYDEADSSAEFLASDARIAGLLPGVENRIVPLSARVRQIADELGGSVIVGGLAAVAEFIPLADAVFKIEGGKVSGVTQAAKALGVQAPAAKAAPADIAALAEGSRWVVPSSLDPSAGRYDASIDAPATHTLVFGRSTIDLSGVAQMADVYQTRTIGLILYYAKLRYMDEPRPIREILDLIDRDLSTDGLEALTRDLRGDLARPRRYEIAAALNRLATLRTTRETR